MAFHTSRFTELHESALNDFDPTDPLELIRSITRWGTYEWIALIMVLCAARVLCEIILWVASPLTNMVCGGFKFVYNITDWTIRRTWQHVTTDSPEPAPAKKAPSFITLEGPINLRTVDGIIGMYGYIDVCGTKIDVLINTQWQEFLPAAIISAEKKEAAVGFSVVSTLELRKEPSSLVSIQSLDGTHLGCGARVNYHGRSILLTCAHVLVSARRAAGSRMFICKQQANEQVMRMEIPDHAWSVFGHTEPTFDAVGICLDKGDVPSPIWSKLGVGVATVKKPVVETSTVTAYGFSTSRNRWQSSCGQAVAAGPPGTYLHNCSTEMGWSGSPLYVTPNQIIGLHRGGHVINRSNAATILFPLFEQLESANRSPGFSEIRPEEMDFREEVTAIDLVGRGRYRYTQSEFTRPVETTAQLEARLRRAGHVLWSEMADEFLAEDLRDQFFESNDSLNCQRGSEILPTPSTLVSEPAVPASSRSLPPPQRTPILVTPGVSPSTTSASPEPVPSPVETPPSGSFTPLLADQTLAQVGIPPAEVLDQATAPSPPVPAPVPSETDRLWETVESLRTTTEDLVELPTQLSKLEQRQEHLTLELSHKIAEMGMQLENRLLGRFSTQQECLSSKLDALMSALESAERPASPEPLRRRRSTSRSSMNMRGQSGAQQPSSLPSSSRQGTTTRYQPRQAS